MLEPGSGLHFVDWKANSCKLLIKVHFYKLNCDIIHSTNGNINNIMSDEKSYTGCGSITSFFEMRAIEWDDVVAER